MRISQILQTKRMDVVVASPDSTVRTAITLMKQERVGALVVVDPSRRLLGVLSERDIIHSLAVEGEDVLRRAVGTIMRTDGPVVTMQDTVQSAMQAMTVKRARHVPIVDGERMVGVVSIGDVVKSRLDEKVQENSVLQDLARLRVLGG